MRSAIAPLAAVAVLLAASACDKTRIVTQVDAGPLCGDGEHLVNGECRFVCNRDGDCPTGERCDLLTGQCVMRPAPLDSGVPPIPCTEGAVRCAVDNGAVERCDATGAWVVDTQCPQPDGYCSNEVCLACRPDSTKCAASGTVVQICAADGSAYRDVPCATPATCVGGECRECDPGQRRCSPDGKSVQECRKLPREDLTWGYVNAGDNFDGTCITQVCQMGAGGPQCKAPDCVPGSTQCLNASTQQLCGPTGSYQNVTCASLPNMGPTAECLNGACVDECGDAARDKSYFGCEYWSAVMDNVTFSSVFKGNTLSGQGTADSEFAFVVSNRSTAPTVVTVQRWFGGAAATVKTVTVPGRTDPATHGLAVIRVPWQSLATDTDYVGVTGQQRYAYRITTTHPVTVYQFNPIAASNRVGSCNNVNQCSLVPSGLGQTCTGGQCNYYAYSNDASLLLPAHILGTSYVGLAPEHIAGRTGSTSGTPSVAFNGTLAIVGTANGTQVTVKASARTRAGGSVTAMNPGETRTFTLNAYDVLQLSSDNPTNVVSGSTTGNLQCGDDPYDNSFTCALGLGCDQLCRVASDLTGTIITATAPIAVFGGSACTLRGYLDTACDHVEEQLFPFVTWGQNFVAARTAPLRLTDNTFATGGNAGPDYYKIVAGCPDSQCPNGTTVSLSTTGVTVLPGSNGCEAGTSLGSTTTPCRLRGGRFVEFSSKTSFKISADKPIQVAQMFAGQNATAGTTRPDEGDPSLVLLPPVEQWRNSYTVLTAPGTRDNYIGLVVDDARVASVQIDGAIVSGWSAVLPGTTFKVVNVPVATGTHTIQVVAKPGQTQLPGAGVTVYGFDSYVSYGYTGGLDLTTIVTGINPGG